MKSPPTDYVQEPWVPERRGTRWKAALSGHARRRRRPGGPRGVGIGTVGARAKRSGGSWAQWVKAASCQARCLARVGELVELNGRGLGAGARSVGCGAGVCIPTCISLLSDGGACPRACRRTSCVGRFAASRLRLPSLHAPASPPASPLPCPRASHLAFLAPPFCPARRISVPLWASRAAPLAPLSVLLLLCWRPRCEFAPCLSLRRAAAGAARRSATRGPAAHNARLRFMRLTHVVEQLRQRAAMDVRMGKEDSARLLLSEKQKVMKALEATRQRAELLEQLAGKLNVAISMKETVLIEVLSSAPLRRSETTDDTSVHHVSPRTEGVSEETIQSGVDEDDIGSRAGLNSDIHLNSEGNADHNLE